MCPRTIGRLGGSPPVVLFILFLSFLLNSIGNCVVSKQSRAKKPKGMSQSTVLTNNFSRINANAEQSLEVWNKTRKIINEMDSELGIED